MQTSNKYIRPGDGKIDRRAVALGVIGFLGLAVVLFFVGLFCIGPMIRSRAEAPREPTQPQAYSPPAEPDRYAADEGEQPVLDIEITERYPAADQHEGEEGLVVTLEPEGRERSRVRPADETGSSDSETEAESGRPSAPAASEMHTFRVQVGTFVSRDNADNLAADLKRRGYSARVKVVESEGRTLYRVQIGEYKNREDADKLSEELSSAGYSPVVVVEKKQE